MRRDYCPWDLLVSFMIMIIGVSEMSHMLGILFHRSLSECALSFLVLSAVCLAVLILPAAFLRPEMLGRTAHTPLTGGEIGLLALLLLLAASQAGFILFGADLYTQGDMTAETVGSFLRMGSIYGENPLTGGMMEEGMPSRLKVLCLPTLYASLCQLLHLTPCFLVWKAVPVVALLGSYAAYVCLGRSLFPGSRQKRLLFLVCVSLLFWVGSYAPGVDGFGLLMAGWRAETLRGAILVPYAVSLCLRRKYLHAVFCCIAETCIIWTSAGLGACAVVTVGLFLTARVKRHRTTGKEEVNHGGTP